MSLSSADVRDFMFDRTAEDNELDMDLSFSPEEIAGAMKRAARAANDIPPYISGYTADTLPDASNVFLYAIAEQLYRSKLQQLMRNDVEYSAGGIQTSITANRIEHFKYLIAEFSKKWEAQVSQMKYTANASQLHYYGN